MRHAAFAAALLALASLLGGCAPSLLVGAGATTGVAASEERGMDGTADDAIIRAQINDLWFKHDHAMFLDVGLQIYEGRVLLTGRVDKESQRDDAVRLAWQPKGVREVINEVRFGAGGGGAEQYGRDTVISSRLRAELLFTKGVVSINYSVRTVEGTVYLLGVAQDQAELNRVIAVARNLADVQAVVNHVILKTDPRRHPATGAS
ncbi:MAG: BON domain-containing protein [Alphaproteobacteria bacterium]|nr:BON domain-containing protein [Alphaproteobacteria bacterium]